MNSLLNRQKVEVSSKYITNVPFDRGSALGVDMVASDMA